MATELGVGYISIVPEVSKISPGIAAALGKVNPVAAASGKRIGGILSTGVSAMLKTGAVAAGTVAGGLLATAMAKGMGRLTAIENAQQKLKGLGNSAETVAGVMASALDAVKGTAHGLGEAASVAAVMVAAGIKPGEQLEQTLKTVGDTAAIAGRSMQDVGLIFGSVAARGRLQGDDMLQLMSSGVPVLQLLAQETGKTAAEISDMVSAGQVDFATFERAMRKGVGGAALAMGDTFQGALANMVAALGRVGATGLKPFFNVAKEGLGAATQAADWVETRLRPVSATVETFLQKQVVPAVKNAGVALRELFASSSGQQLFSETKQAVLGVVDAGRALAPVAVSIAASLGQAGAALGVSSWSLFVAALQAAGAAAGALAGPLGAVSGLLGEHPGLVTAAVVAWGAMRTVPQLMVGISDKFQALNERVGAATDGLRHMRPAFDKLSAWSKETGAGLTKLDIAMQAVGDRGTGTMQKIAQAYTHAAMPLRDASNNYRVLAGEAKAAVLASKDAFTSVDYIAQQAGRSVQSSVTGMAATVKGVGAASFTTLKSAASGVVDVFGGPWGVAIMAAGVGVTAFAQANQHARGAQQAMAEATLAAAKAQRELQAAVAGTTGALSEQGLAAAAEIVNGQLAELQHLGSSGWVIEAPNMSWWEQGFWNEDFNAYRDKVGGLKDALSQLENTAAELGIPMSQLNSVVAEGGPRFHELVAALQASGDAGGTAAKQLQQARDEVERQVDAARSLDPAIVGVAKSMEVLADTGATAADKLGALHEIMDKLSGGTLTADEAQAKLVEDVEKTAETVAETAETMRQLGPINLDPDGSIDTTTKAGAQAYQAFQELSDSMVQAAANGVPVEQVFAQQQENLDGLQHALGLTDDEFQNMLRSYGLTREVLGLPLKMAGAETVQQQVETLALGLENLSVGAEIEIAPPDPAVLVGLEELGFRIETLPNGNVMVTATTEAADADLGMLKGKVEELGNSHAQITASLDTTPMLLTTEQAKAIGAELDGMDVSPEADLIIAKLLQGKDVSIGELQILSGETAIPAADLNKTLLQQKVDESKVSLANLRDTPVNPKIGADNSGLKQAVAESKSWLATLKDHVVNIFTYRHDAKRFGGVVGLAQGGVVGTARGYRLPLAGPGASEVDGFQGIDGQGRPTARVDAGEFVTNRDSTQRFLPVLWALNRNDTHTAMKHLEQRLASGGVVGVSAKELLRFARGETVNGQRASRSLEGAVYEFAGINWGDCSAAVSSLARFAVGLDAFAARFATGNQGQALAAMGFSPGLGNPSKDFSIGWFNGGSFGGHTSATIAGTNVEMGGERGNGQIGGGAAPASHPQYTDHAHLRLEGSTRGKHRDTDVADDPQDSEPRYQSLRRPSSKQRQATTGTSSEPQSTSISGILGSAASAFVSGITQDALGVFGIPDSPPVLNTYAQWRDATTTTGGNTAMGAQDLEDALADAEDDLEAARRWLEASEERLATLPADASEITRQATQKRVDSARSAVAEAERAVAQAEHAYVAGPSNTQNLNNAYGGFVEHIVGRVHAAVPPVVDAEFRKLLDSLGVRGFQHGGLVTGPGTGTSDSIPILASNQEFVVNAAATAKHRGLLEAINAGDSLQSAAPKQTHYHIHGGDVGEVLRRLEARELAVSMQHLGG